MSNIDKRALREVAGKATPGPWLWINTGSFFSFLVSESNQDPHQCIIDDGTAWGEYGETINPESHDGVFIAAANPATVLALLDELEEATDACNGWQKKFSEADERLEAAEKRIAELEAREVKLPAEKFCPAEYAGSQLWEETEIWNKAVQSCDDAIRTAGFKVAAAGKGE